jgi:hypothetical protein
MKRMPRAVAERVREMKRQDQSITAEQCAAAIKKETGVEVTPVAVWRRWIVAGLAGRKCCGDKTAGLGKNVTSGAPPAEAASVTLEYLLKRWCLYH